MNRNEFNRFVAGIDLPGPGDLEGLRELTVLFPWFHSAHLVLLKGLRENSDIRFDSQLKASALSVNDREVLYHYLFLPPDQVSPEPEIPVKEEVSVPKEELIAPDQVSSEPENLVKEEVGVPEEEMIAPVEELIASVEEEVAPATEDNGPVEEVSAPEEEMISTVTEVDHDEPDESRDSVEIPAEDEVPVMPEEEEILSTTEADELLTPDVPEEIMASVEVEVTEGQGILASDEAAVTDEGQAEESPGDEIDVAEADPNARLRTREDLLAEIEERLKELESYRQVTFREPKAEVIIETVGSPEPEIEQVPAPAPEIIEEPEPDPEIEEIPAPAPEIIEASVPIPEIEEPPVPEPEIEEPPAPEPEIEEPPAPEPEAAPEPDLEPESTELLELLPEIVAEDQQPQPEKKLSPADLIDRFIMISPNIERMSPKDYQPVRDLSEQDSGEPGKFITETLAKIYINQGYYTRAINIYEKLTLQYPEKSAYFASRIEKIKDLIK